MNTDPTLFRSALPFPHLVRDDACPEPILEAAMPAFDLAEWRTFHGDHENDKSQAAPPIPALPLFRWMRSLGPELETITGIAGLELDLLGGGLHQTTRGGHLDMHVDFNRHPDGRYRRLNCLLFANKDWEWHHFGSLNLGQDCECDTSECEHGGIIPPVWNRLVVFETSETTWHGHPEFWSSDTPRKSFAGYWYTKEPPATVVKEHSTIWGTR